MSHGAPGILGGYVFKSCIGIGVGEGMQKGDAAVEFCLNGWGAGDREGNLAKLLWNAVIMLLLRRQATVRTS